MEKSVFFQEKYIKVYKAAGVTIGVYLLFRYALALFAPFVAAYLVAGAVRPVVLFLKRRLHIPMSIGGALVLLLLLGVLGTGIFFLGKMFIQQLILFIRNYAGYRESFYTAAGRICCNADRWFSLEDGTVEGLLHTGLARIGEAVNRDVLPEVSKQSFAILRTIGIVVAGCVIAFVAALLLLNDREKYADSCKKSVFYEEIKKVSGRLTATGIAYLKTQCILFLLVAAICTTGFLFVKKEYALLLGLTVAILDAFPVLGSGLVLVPWSVICLLKGNYLQTVVLIVTYLGCLFVREGLEPKLLGNRIGIPPLYTLMAVYVGVELFGLFGVILGPLGLVVIRSVLDIGIKGTEGDMF